MIFKNTNMIRHYFKIAIRNLHRRRLDSTINLVALTIGFTFSFILLIYVFNQNSYDRFQKNGNRVYRIIENLPELGMKMPGAPFPLFQMIKNDRSDLEKIVPADILFGRYENEVNKNVSIRMVGTESDLFSILKFNVVEGNQEEFLKDPYDLIIAQSIAEKLYPGKKALGEVLKMNINGEDELLTIKGVFKDLPWNSSLQVKCFCHVSWAIKNLEKIYSTKDIMNSWVLGDFQVYILLRKGTDVKQFKEYISGLSKYRPKEDGIVQFSLQNLKNFYYHSSDLANNPIKSGNLKTINIFFLVALLIIIIACINYVILSSASSMTRYKEIAYRKVSGASQYQIQLQFIGEAILLSLISLFLSLLAVKALIPHIKTWFDLNLYFTLNESIRYILVFVFIAIISGIISGGYVAFYYSRLNIVLAFSQKGEIKSGKFIIWKALLIIQIILLIGTTMVTSGIRRQISFMQTSDLGFNSRNLIKLGLSKTERSKYYTIKDELKKDPNVLNVCGANFLPPYNGGNRMAVAPVRESDKKVTMDVLGVDNDFIEMFGIKIKSGRNFSPELASDSVNAKIVNETAALALGINSISDSSVVFQKYVGIVNDFFLHSMHEKIMPMMITLSKKEYLREIGIRYREGTQKQVENSIKILWKELFGDSLPNFESFEESIQSEYTKEAQLLKILKVFTFLVAFISAMGLFALSLLVLKKRSKEIAIRKVNGATYIEIFLAISMEFLRLALIAMIFAWPSGWYIIHRWQENFAYHENTGVLIFLVSGFITIIIIQVSILLHAFQAVKTNLVDTLKSE